jgi:signal transduction histidine kinase
MSYLCHHTEGRGSELVISIIDNGKGIDPEIMPRLFSKFATRSFDGTGLGLFIAKSIIEAHGSRIGLTTIPTAKELHFCLAYHYYPNSIIKRVTIKRKYR